MAAKVHYKEFVVGDEADSVGTGWEFVAVDIECGFSDEVGLVSLLDARGVAAGVDFDGKHVGAAREVDASGVSLLHGCALTLEVDRWGNQRVQISGVQQYV